MSGRLHRVEYIFILSFSPLLFCFVVLVSLHSSDVGEIHRVVIVMYSRSPLSDPVCFDLIKIVDFHSDVGEIHRSLFSFLYSRSPPCEPKLITSFAPPLKWPFLNYGPWGMGMMTQ